MWENHVSMYVHFELIQFEFKKCIFTLIYFTRLSVEEVSVAFCSGKNFACLVHRMLTLFPIIS